MSLSLAIALVVLADLALIGLLAFVMSRAARLTPHESRAAQSIVSETTPAPARRTLRTAGRPAHRGRQTVSSRS
jgi:hypothetical protein